MMQRLATATQHTVNDLLNRWRLLLVLALAGGWIAFAFWVSDVQGRMDLPRAYSVRMTCEDDPEAVLWHGGCERIAADIAVSGRPGFADLYRAFVAVHHDPAPREATAVAFAAAPADAHFDVGAALAGQRYGLALVTPEFEGVQSQAHADAIKDAIDVRDRALLVIGRAGLGVDALIAGALANLTHPLNMIEDAAQLVRIQAGTAKTSDIGVR